MALIVYPPTIDWSWMKQRPQQLMQALARIGHTVIYCNRTFRDQPPEPIENRLTVIHDHERWIAESWPNIRKNAVQPVIVWCTNPKLAAHVDVYEADATIYDCVDEFAEWLPDEPEMVARSTALSCTSERLYQRLARAYPHKRAALIRNAYDTDMGLHRQAEIRAAAGTESANKSGGVKKVGYVGAWAPWVDEALVRRIARLSPKIEMIVIGPEFGRKQQNAPGERIRFLGLQPHSMLAEHIGALDVCIIPFRLNPVTLSTNPVKVYEYLAAGKPIVSTALPECELLQPDVDIGRTHGQFVDHIVRRLDDPGDGTARTAAALSNTWRHRAVQADALIRETLPV